MKTSPIEDVATPQSNYEKYKDRFSDKKKDQLSMESFYSLLIAEMSNQDPLEPTSNTEFISQMASFAALQSQQDNFDMQKQNYANSLVGQTVALQAPGAKKDELVKGVVDHVVLGSDIKVSVNGTNYSLTSIKQVYGFENLLNAGEEEQQTADSSLENYGAFAAGILGKTITVQATKPNGELLLDSGTAQSLEIKDGQVRVILNGVAYNVTDIVSVTDAVKVRGDDDSGDDEDEKPVESASNTAQTTTKPEQTTSQTEQTNQTEQTAQTGQTNQTAQTGETGEPLAERTDEEDIKDITDPTGQTEQMAPWIAQSEAEELRDLFGT